MGLFREEAYNNYSSMVNTTANVKTVRVGVLTAAIAVIVVFAAVMTWLFTGNITETVNVDGIVTTDGGNVGIYAEISGTVSDVFVWSGAKVEAGDVIAVIPNKDKLSEIEAMRKSGADEDEINRLKNEYYSVSFIRALKSGIVRSVISDGQYINTGDKIAEMTVVEDYANNNKIIAFIPSYSVQALSTGLDVQVSPDFAPREQYGYIKGYISDIGAYPRTKESILEEYGIDELKNIIDDDISYMSVEITLIPDSESVSSVKWSSPKGNSLNVDAGTVCTGSVVVKSCKPYQWLLQ